MSSTSPSVIPEPESQPSTSIDPEVSAAADCGAAKMAEVITLSDSDDDVIAVACSSPMVRSEPVARSPMGVKTDTNRPTTAQVHITHGASINLEQLGIRKGPVHVPSPINRHLPQHLQNRQNTREIPRGVIHRGPISQNRMGERADVPMAMVNRWALENVNKRFRPPPPPPGTASASTAPTLTRTRHQMNQMGGPKQPKPYEGHYMFEASETDELERRPPKHSTRKFDGKFVCSYNPSECYKLCDSTREIINHVWTHVAIDRPPRPLPAALSKPPSRLGLTIYSEGTNMLLSDNNSEVMRKMHTCTDCNVMFRTTFEMHHHTISCHLYQDFKPTVCNICEMDLKTGINLENHLKRHVAGDAPYNCSKCKYRTSVRQFFLQHYMQRHSNEVLMCPICLYTEDLRPNNRRSRHIFVRHFTEHMRLHAESPQYRCRKCALSFNDVDELTTHRAHDHSPLNPLWQVRVRRVVLNRRKKSISKCTKLTMLQKMYFERTMEGKRVADEVAVKGGERKGQDTSLAIPKKREQYSTLEDPAEELEIFAVFPPFTATELETQAEFEKRVEVESPDEAYILDTEEIEFQEIDNLLMLKMMAKEESDEIIAQCLANVVDCDE